MDAVEGAASSGNPSCGPPDQAGAQARGRVRCVERPTLPPCVGAAWSAAKYLVREQDAVCSAQILNDSALRARYNSG